MTVAADLVDLGMTAEQAEAIAALAGGGSGITQLTGDVTAGPGSGSQAATLANSGVVAGSYTSANITVDAKGRVTAAANGSGGSSTWTETEVDFGSTPTWSKTFTITDAAVSGTSKILPIPSGNVATGRVGNDLEWDNLLLGALAGAGNFLLTALAVPGPIVGKRKIHYQVA